MMSALEAQEILNKVEFLDFKFEVVTKFAGAIDLQITFSPPDSRDRTKSIKILHEVNIYLDHIETAEDFIRIIHETVIRVLTHEVGELFKVDGIAPFDEHIELPGLYKQNWNLISAMFTKEKSTISNQQKT